MRLLLRTIALCGIVAIGSPAMRASAQSTIVQWNFNNENLVPSTLDPNFAATPTISALNTTAASSFVTPGNNGSSDPQQINNPSANFTYEIAGFPAQGTGSGTSGYLYTFNTTNYTLNDFSYDFRPSGGPSGWQQLQYSINGGSTWETMSIPNPTNSPNIVDASGSSTSGSGTFLFFPNDHWSNQGVPAYNQVIDLTKLPDYASINNNPNFEIRDVAVFSPIAFTDSTASYAANTAYMRADSSNQATFAPQYTSNGSSYTNTSNWRIDMATLTGTYHPPVFSPANLTWNAGSGTWDTVATNKPWLNGATASPFHQNGGQGDNVTFTNPTSGSVVTVQAGGVTPNSTTISTNGTLTFTGGSIGGTGSLVKTGSGTLILDNSNTFTGANGNPNSITGGILETHQNSSLGSGPFSLTNTTWNATTNNQTSPGAVTLNGAININTTTNLNLPGGLAGSGTLTKGGAGTLELNGLSTNTGQINVTQGTVQLDGMNALGGNPVTPSIAPVMSFSNSSLVFNGTGKGSSGANSQLSNNITLTNATVSRLALSGGQITGNTGNGDSHLTSYDSNGNFSGGIITVHGNSSIINYETRTAGLDDTGGPGSAGSSNQLDINMPVLITSGSTLTSDAVNGTLTVNAQGPNGTLANTAVAFHGVSGLDNSNHSITLQAGATIAATGAGETRFGSSTTGVPFIGLGTSASESTIKADSATFMTDLAGNYADTQNVNSLFVVAGSGTGGLRVEAPLNANYTLNPNTGQIATTGLFGDNPDQSMTTAGNVYTIMSPNRYAGLSGFAGMPTQTPDGAALPALGGTITLAGTDSGTGAVDNGPAAGTAVKLGLDNTSTSGPITYTINPTANGGAFANFGGLVLKQTGSASVTTQLLGDTTLTGASPSSTTFTQSGGTFNLNGHAFTVGGAASISGGTVTGASSSFTAGSINFSAGALAPSSGPSTPGTITLTSSNTTFGHGSALNYELGTAGTIGGGANSLTEVHGNLTLGGTLNITELSGFGSGANNGVGAYRLMDYTGSLTNNGLTLGSVPVGFAGTTIQTSQTGQVNLDLITIPGDVNGDHIVNGQDIAEIASNWLSSGFNVPGDGNFDGIVNGQDIALVASNWLQMGGGGGIGGGSSVPEPGSCALCLVGIVVGLAWRLRGRRGRV